MSAAIAVTFVYFVATKKTFINNKGSLQKKYILYLLYQVISILLSSLLIGYLSTVISMLTPKVIAIQNEILAKIIVTPITFLSNFIFMKFLIEKM